MDLRLGINTIQRGEKVSIRHDARGWRAHTEGWHRMNIVPVHNMAVLPHSFAYFGYDDLTRALGHEPTTGEGLALLVTRDEAQGGDLTAERVMPIGVRGTVREVSGYGFVVVRTGGRVTVTVGEAGEVSLAELADVEDMAEEEQRARIERIRAAATAFYASTQWAAIASRYIAQWRTASDALAMMSLMMVTTNEELYAILAQDSVAKRWEMAETAVFECLEMTRLMGEGKSEQEKDTRERYREGAIRKQMEYLQRQLDDLHPESVSDVRKFQERINASGMNDEARAEAEKVLNRMRQEGKDGHEYGALYDYLDFVTSLAWKTGEPDRIDLDEAQAVLDEDHFGLAKVKRRILQQIAVMDLNRRQSGSILLFVGAPGTGKTSIGQSIARALHRRYVRVSLGGVRDEADIRGHRRTYVGAMPGRIMDGIRKSGVANPVMVLDEVDKLGSSYNGDPASALLEVLDPEQNATFTDHYMNVPYDLSNVLFICTANTLDSIPEPLLDRMEVIRFTGYTPTEKQQIARQHLIPRALAAAGIDERALRVEDDALAAIISDYTAEGGVRGLKRRIDELCRIAAVDIVRARAADATSAATTSDDDVEKPARDAESARAEAPVVTVTTENLRSYLDAHPMHHEAALANGRPGVVAGLAWTSAGGEILHIESLFTRGTGKLTVTGQLGDVMRESVQIAVSLVKANYPEAAQLFEQNDLHVHVPAGSVPKDGPSAGVTLTTAIASLVTGHAVDPRLAMTGEVSLRGAVMPIGGLPEKLMAAQRAGVTRVLIPADNVDDLEDVAEEVRTRLEIVPVATVDEVLMQAGVWPGTPAPTAVAPSRVAGGEPVA